MFDWATMRSTVRLRGQFGELAGFDGWLDGWTLGSLRDLAERERPGSIHIEGVPSTERSQKLWLDLEKYTERSNPSGRTFGMAIVAQMDPAQVFAPPSIDTAFDSLNRLNAAAQRVKPGGILAWCHYLSFANDDEAVSAMIEPAAVLQSFGHRGFQPLDGNAWGVGRIRIYNDPDTVFATQQATLSLWSQHRRVTKVLCAMRKTD